MKKTEKITRKEAIKKAGVTALTATTMLFLQTKPAAANSQPTDTNDAAAAPGTEGPGGTARPSR